MATILVIARCRLKRASRAVGFEAFTSPNAVVEGAQVLVRTIAIAIATRRNEVTGIVRTALRMRTQMIRLPDAATRGTVRCRQLLATMEAAAAALLEHFLAGSIADITATGAVEMAIGSVCTLIGTRLAARRGTTARHYFLFCDFLFASFGSPCGQV